MTKTFNKRRRKGNHLVPFRDGIAVKTVMLRIIDDSYLHREEGNVSTHITRPMIISVRWSSPTEYEIVVCEPAPESHPLVARLVPWISRSPDTP